MGVVEAASERSPPPTTWRERFMVRFGPGLLGGITFGDWLRLLRERRFALAPACLPRALSITFQSLRTSLLRRRERRRYGSEIERAVIEPPLFVLGHWRNGTTHLHNLLAVDRRFAFPNNYQVSFPHTFLTTEAADSRWLRFFLPEHRPMDNVSWDLSSPQEDEFALCTLSQKSPCMGWVFPGHRDRYDPYLTLRGTAEGEVEEWLAALELFLKKLTSKYRRPLVLKSPPHTCRIRLLLRRFPGARFVHVHRDPYAVFRSAKRAFLVNFTWSRLERARLDDLDEWILRQYREMYDVFFEERALIPAGQFCEVRFTDVETDPIGQVRRIYQTLGLPDFAEVEPALREYVTSIAGYRKNDFQEIGADLRSRIGREWSRCFEEWGYPR